MAPPSPTGHSHRIMRAWGNNCPPLFPQKSMTSGQKSGKASFSLNISSLRLCGKHTSVGPMPPSLKAAGHNFTAKKSIPFNRPLKCIEKTLRLWIASWRKNEWVYWFSWKCWFDSAQERYLLGYLFLSSSSLPKVSLFRSIPGRAAPVWAIQYSHSFKLPLSSH